MGASGIGKLPRWLVALTAVCLFLMHLPVLVLIAFSFNASKFAVTWTGFTLAWYRRLLERDDILHALQASLIVGVTATAIAVTLGTLIALALARHRFRGRTVYEGMMYVPIVTPEIVTGISLLVLFVFLRMPLGLATIIIAHVAFCVPFVVVVVVARLAGMDENLEEAAMTLGADEVTTFFRITLPLLWPGIVSAALLSFILSFDDFVITSLVAGSGSSTLPLVIYSMVRRNIEPSINAISALIVVATSVLLYVSDRMSRRNEPSNA
jgi:spermidine/putrescine transport system permease protein